MFSFTLKKEFVLATFSALTFCHKNIRAATIFFKINSLALPLSTYPVFQNTPQLYKLEPETTPLTNLLNYIVRREKSQQQLNSKQQKHNCTMFRS